jgi:hypothetical protein
LVLDDAADFSLTELKNLSAFIDGDDEYSISNNSFLTPHAEYSVK